MTPTETVLKAGAIKLHYQYEDEGFITIMFRMDGRQLCSFFLGLNYNMLQKPIYCLGEEILFLLFCLLNPSFCCGLLWHRCAGQEE